MELGFYESGGIEGEGIRDFCKLRDFRNFCVRVGFVFSDVLGVRYYVRDCELFFKNKIISL